MEQLWASEDRALSHGLLDGGRNLTSHLEVEVNYGCSLEREPAAGPAEQLSRLNPVELHCQVPGIGPAQQLRDQKVS